MNFLILLAFLANLCNCVFFFQCHYKGVAGVGTTYNLYKKCKPGSQYMWQWSNNIGGFASMMTGGKPFDCVKKGCKASSNQLRKRDCVSYSNSEDKCKMWDGGWTNV